MTFTVKSKKRDGKVYNTVCDDLPHTLEIIEDQRAREFEVWVEDAGGKRIDDPIFASLIIPSPVEEQNNASQPKGERRRRGPVTNGPT